MAGSKGEALLELAAVVEARTGLAAGLDSGAQASRRLTAAMARLDATTLAAQAGQLASLPPDTPEWQRLIDGLLVPETYFFRDEDQLKLMREAGLVPRIAFAGKDRAIRLWSAGCCTGEEAYTLAILALQVLAKGGHATETHQAFVLKPGWSLDVLGTDISASMVERARAGAYASGASLSAFRSTAPESMRYFPIAGGMRRVRADVARHVHFSRAGLLEDGLPAGPFDIVSCRNVLIYLSDRARRAALEVLAAAVRPGGVLMLGPTDPAPDTPSLQPVWGSSAMVYRRVGP